MIIEQTEQDPIKIIREAWIIFYDGSEGHPSDYMRPTQVYDSEEAAKGDCYRIAYSPKKIYLCEAAPKLIVSDTKANLKISEMYRKALIDLSTRGHGVKRPKWVLKAIEQALEKIGES